MKDGDLMLSKAIILATNAHEGQVDRQGEPYILHPLRVMLNSKNQKERICAVLHDIVEDTDITFDDLRSEGFSEEIIEIVDCLTKRDGEDYFDYIERVLTNKTACQIKISDLNDNMDSSRNLNSSQKDTQRIKKYKKAKEIILENLKYT